MKKILSIALGVVMIASMSSCKKDYTCTCTTTTTGVGNTTSSYTITDTKDSAKAKCDTGDVSAFGISSTNCEIK